MDMSYALTAGKYVKLFIGSHGLDNDLAVHAGVFQADVTGVI